MMATLMMMALTLSLIFLFLNHPLSFGIILLAETLIISAMTGLMNRDFWFSYIIFIVMVGGMLVLFIYMTSVASNEKFKFSHKLNFFMMLCLTPLLVFFFTDSLLYSLSLFNQMFNLNYFENPLLTEYINFPTNKIMVMAITYLLITLIMVVKITNVQHGPLRQKF